MYAVFYVLRNFATELEAGMSGGDYLSNSCYSIFVCTVTLSVSQLIASDINSHLILSRTVNVKPELGDYSFAISTENVHAAVNFKLIFLFLPVGVRIKQHSRSKC